MEELMNGKVIGEKSLAGNVHAVVVADDHGAAWHETHGHCPCPIRSGVCWGLSLTVYQVLPL
jgi:hypothetical protein